jgi:hypothetical protein
VYGEATSLRLQLLLIKMLPLLLTLRVEEVTGGKLNSLMEPNQLLKSELQIDKTAAVIDSSSPQFGLETYKSVLSQIPLQMVLYTLFHVLMQITTQSNLKETQLPSSMMPLTILFN